MSRFLHHASIGALALASAAFIQAARTTYSNTQADKDEQKLSVPFNDTHHIEIHPEVLKSNNGQVHNLSRIRITANQPEQTSYSYNVKTMRIEGYEFYPDRLPDFLKDKKSLSDIQKRSCDALQNYSPIDTSYLTAQAQEAIKRRTEGALYMTRTFCS